MQMFSIDPAIPSAMRQEINAIPSTALDRANEARSEPLGEFSARLRESGLSFCQAVFVACHIFHRAITPGGWLMTERALLATPAWADVRERLAVLHAGRPSRQRAFRP